MNTSKYVVVDRVSATVVSDHETIVAAAKAAWKRGGAIVLSKDGSEVGEFVSEIIGRMKMANRKFASVDRLSPTIGEWIPTWIHELLEDTQREIEVAMMYGSRSIVARNGIAYRW